VTGTRVILVDDEPDLRASTAQALDLEGFAVQDLAEAARALDLVSFGFPGVVVTDIRMPGMDGLTLMNRIHEIDRDIPVILFTGHGDVQLAVRAMREGAYDFIEKPFSVPQLAEIVARAADYRRLVVENRLLRAAAGQADDLETRLVGRSPAMIDLRRRIRTIGPAEADVLIVGETGTGKDLVAARLHDLSPRARRPFVAIDCAALPPALIESELFGHEAGAFAGALGPRVGKFEHARGGTILLDDIGRCRSRRRGAPARDRAARDHAARLERGDPPRRALHGDEPRRRSSRDRGGAVPRRPALPAERGHADRAAAVGPRPRTWRPCSSSSWPRPGSATGSSRPAPPASSLRSRRWTGPATCANCATPPTAMRWA
jgi:FixJ family two-component response regulator